MTRRPLIRFALLLASLLAPACASLGLDAPDPQDVLTGMEHTYAGCRTYRDSGTSTTRLTTLQGTQTNSSTFTTAFLRPSRLRFEWSLRLGDLPGVPHLLWADGAEVRLQQGPNPPVRYAELEDALVDATAPSSGDALRIPRLLLPDTTRGPSLLDNLVDARLLGREPIDGHPCWKLRADHDRGGYVVLWVDVESHLLRMYEYPRELRSLAAVTTVVYEPEVDVPLDPAELSWEGPAGE